MSGLVKLEERHGYTTSRDYALLWDIAHQQSVVCFLDYRTDGRALRDVAATKVYRGTVDVGVRGMCYVWAEDTEDFQRQCERVRLEFIPPGPLP